MNRKQFQTLAVRTESIVETPMLTTEDFTVFTQALKAFNAAVEVLDAYKKHIFYVKPSGESVPLDRNKVKEHIAKAKNHLFEAQLANVEAEQKMEKGLPMQAHPIPTEDARVFHALLGSITEHGEIGIALDRSFDLNGTYDLINVCEELGDSDWYKALFFEATGIDWETVQRMIIKKLEVRYKDKIFNSEEAHGRDLESERNLLKSMINEAIEEYREQKKAKNSIV